jgi:hypothetical protein
MKEIEINMIEGIASIEAIMVMFLGDSDEIRDIIIDIQNNIRNGRRNNISCKDRSGTKCQYY